MKTMNEYITSNFTPSEPYEFAKWCEEIGASIHGTGYGQDVYIRTSRDITMDGRLVRFTKCKNPEFRSVMLCAVRFARRECMGCDFYCVSDNGIKACGSLSYSHNPMRFFRVISEAMGSTTCWDWIGKPKAIDDKLGKAMQAPPVP